MATYASRVRADIARWQEAGLIDAAIARGLSDDIERHARGGFSFGSILAMLAAILFGAAILIFVAANWEAFPRLARIGLLLAAIAGGYVGGALLKLRDQAGAGEALFMIASASFGAAIALTGQMYHLSGDEQGAILTWGAGVALAALLLRSGPQTAAAVALAGVWLWLDVWDFWRDEPLPHEYLAMLTLLWAVSLWTGSRAARHLILLSLIGYTVMLYLRSDLFLVLVLLAVASAMLFLAATRAEAMTERVLRLGGGAALQGLIGFATGMMLIQAALIEGPVFIVAALVAFGGSIAALLMAGRDSRALRWLSYLFFAVELCFVYLVTVGTMLDTAGFLLVAGLILAAMAIAITRMERRLRAEPSPTGASS